MLLRNPGIAIAGDNLCASTPRHRINLMHKSMPSSTRVQKCWLGPARKWSAVPRPQVQDPCQDRALRNHPSRLSGGATHPLNSLFAEETPMRSPVGISFRHICETPCYRTAPSAKVTDDLSLHVEPRQRRENKSAGGETVEQNLAEEVVTKSKPH